MFADIARDIAGGEPPEWLVQALEELARQVAIAGLSEEGDPKRAELRSRFGRVQTAAKKMDRTLDAIHNGLLWMTLDDLDNLRTIRGALRTATELCDRVLKEIPTASGPTRARRQAGPTARVTCAIIVIEARETVCVKLRGAHNERIGEICMKYWRACGGPLIGKGSKGGGPDNWRRPMEEALSDNSALREYVRSELRRRAAL
jgi:hypothetical protein